MFQKDGGNSSEEIKVNDNSIESLKAKLNQLNNPGAQNNPSPQVTNSMNQSINQIAGQQNQGNGQIRAADAEYVADNERIINLIMQQIKELIEIDNNLNIKLKEIENKSVNMTRDIEQSKKTVATFNERLENIEKNMEKFMGLYELVTNKYNPFVEEPEKESYVQEQGSVASTIKPLPIQSSINEAIMYAKEDIKSDSRNSTNSSTKLSKESYDNKAQEPDNTNRSTKNSDVQNKFQTMKSNIEQEKKVPANNTINTPKATINAKTASDDMSSTMNMISEEIDIGERLENLKNSQNIIESFSSQIVKDSMSYHNVPNITDSISESNIFRNPMLHKEISQAYHLETEDGRTIKTLNDFVTLLQEMNDHEINEHIVSQKDNYAQWLTLALNDPELTKRFSASGNSKIHMIESLVRG